MNANVDKLIQIKLYTDRRTPIPESKSSTRSVSVMGLKKNQKKKNPFMTFMQSNI